MQVWKMNGWTTHPLKPFVFNFSEISFSMLFFPSSLSLPSSQEPMVALENSQHGMMFKSCAKK